MACWTASVAKAPNRDGCPIGTLAKDASLQGGHGRTSALLSMDVHVWGTSDDHCAVRGLGVSGGRQLTHWPLTPPALGTHVVTPHHSPWVPDLFARSHPSRMEVHTHFPARPRRTRSTSRGAHRNKRRDVASPWHSALTKGRRSFFRATPALLVWPLRCSQSRLSGTYIAQLPSLDNCCLASVLYISSAQLVALEWSARTVQACHISLGR